MNFQHYGALNPGDQILVEDGIVLINGMAAPEAQGRVRVAVAGQ